MMMVMISTMVIDGDKGKEAEEEEEHDDCDAAAAGGRRRAVSFGTNKGTFRFPRATSKIINYKPLPCSVSGLWADMPLRCGFKIRFLLWFPFVCCLLFVVCCCLMLNAQCPMLLK